MEKSRIGEVTHYCDACLGRIFSSVSTGLTNSQRGKIVRQAFSAISGQDLTKTDDCSICSELFENLSRYLEICLEHVSGYEFRTFRIGSIFSPGILENEKSVQENFGQEGESLKKEFNRELGKLMSDSLNVDFSQNSPEVEFTVDTRYDVVRMRVESVFIYGTYKKLVRGIPQTRWIHGSGDTVESLVGKPATEMLEGTEYFLHGAGREDVDVRMLGNGREFIIEIASPKRRSPDLRELRETVNHGGIVSIHNLKVVDKREVAALKLAKHDKTYRLLIEADGKIDDARLKDAVESLNGKVIYQRTPLRVSRRRADLIRERRLLQTRLISRKGTRIAMEVTAEAGTYIKEMVSGDKGRTKPSLSSEYGSELKVAELDVIRIHR